MTSRWLWLILAFALAVRAALLAAAWQDLRRTTTPDSDGYCQLARSLADRGEFSMAGRGEIFRTPGYPAFLLAADALSGTWVGALVAQVLLDTALVLLTVLLGRLLAGSRLGLIAAAFQALSPVAIAASCRLLSDSLYALLLTSVVLLLISHFKTGRWRSLIAAAVVMAAACYVRPVGLVMAATCAAVLLCRPKRFRRAGAFAAIVIAAIAPWVARNAVVADYVGFSSFATDSMYNYSAPKLLAGTEGISDQAAADRMQADLHRHRQADALDTPGDLARYRRREALKIITARPWTYAKIHACGCLAFWLPGATDVLEVAGLTTGQRGTLAVFQQRGLVAAAGHYFAGNIAAMILAAVMSVLPAAKYLGVMMSLAKRFRPGISAAGWLMLLLVAVSALAGGPAATARFRLAVEPLLSLAAAYGAIVLIEMFRKRRLNVC